MAKTETRN